MTKGPFGGFRVMNSSIGYARIGAQPTVLVSGGHGTMGVDPVTGKILWSYKMPVDAPFPYCGLASAAWGNYVIDTISAAHDNSPSEIRCLKIEK